ncbi:CMRF35-like molecule 2 isoform X3 [Tachysurus fulvidraco]|uniref:CMRF35-like molecule 2 isoform X3 n=1 Tax=Tachysurus fulvidraco TaxID=1234273 RepID=UPI001FF00458|nr:CMRF35-like molecule 2 isoform X3 [Tachysurus fulvidraco]
MNILLIFTLCLISDGGASNEVTGYSGGGILIKCKYGAKVTQSPKYFCKGSMSVCSDQIKTGNKNQWVNSGRYSLFDDTKSSAFWVMIRELTVLDTGMYQCGVNVTTGNDIKTSVELKIKEGFPASTVIAVSVILLLLLIGIIILILTLKNRHKMQGTFQNSGNDQGVPLDVHEYEEIKITRRLSASNAEMSTVYVTAQLPTISADRHAAYTELPTKPCDSAVYSFAQLPTIPSDQNIYSKAQLPTCLSAQCSTN